jgi:hypothetical protein
MYWPNVNHHHVLIYTKDNTLERMELIKLNKNTGKLGNSETRTAKDGGLSLSIMIMDGINA